VSDEGDVLDSGEAAKYLRVNVQTVRRLAREGRLPAFRVGHVWRFKRSSLGRWEELQGGFRRPRAVLVVDDGEVPLSAVARVFEKEGMGEDPRCEGDAQVHRFSTGKGGTR